MVAHISFTALRTSPPRTRSAAPGRTKAPQPALDAFTVFKALLSHVSDRYDQQPRRPGGNKWRRAIKGTQQPITAEHLAAHLAGSATYAARLADESGMARLLVADDDHGGIAAAQAAVDHLAQQGVTAWAIARRSLDNTGQPRHDGSRLFVLLDEPGYEPDLKPALVALLAPSGYSTDEVMRRAELPFGRSRWTPDGDEWGQLVLAGHAPRRITSGAQGVLLLVELGGLAPNNLANVLSFAPAKPAPVRVKAEPKTYGNTLINGTDRDVVAAFPYELHDVCRMSSGFRRCGALNYRCDCSGHPHGDRNASIGLSNDGKLIYFNSPTCRYHNGGRPYTAFSLWQTLEHGGNYRAAINEARRLLNMPFVATPAAEPARLLQPARIQSKAPPAAKAIIDSIARRVKTGDDKLSAAAKSVLRAVCRLARQTGHCSPSWAQIANHANCAEPTARRAVARLVELGYLAKHANATERGQYAPNVLELLPQSAEMITTPVMADHGLNDQSIDSIKEEEVHCTKPLGEAATPDDFSLFNSPAPKHSMSADALRSAVWHVHATALLHLNPDTGEVLPCRKSFVVRYVHSLDPLVPLAEIAACHAAVMREKRLLDHEQYCLDLERMSDQGLRGELRNHKRSLSRAEGKKQGYWNLKIRAVEIEQARRGSQLTLDLNKKEEPGRAGGAPGTGAPPARRGTAAATPSNVTRCASLAGRGAAVEPVGGSAVVVAPGAVPGAAGGVVGAAQEGPKPMNWMALMKYQRRVEVAAEPSDDELLAVVLASADVN